MNRSICMLYQGNKPHPAHLSFGEAIDCQYRHFETGQPLENQVPSEHPDTIGRIKTGLGLARDFDIIIAEGSAPLQTGLVYRTARNQNAVLLYLGADETFYTLRNRPTRYLWRGLRPLTSRLVAGAIFVSNRVVDWCDPYLGSLPNQIVHPPIPDERYERLAALKPNSPDTPFEILSVGANRTNKNFGALVEAVGSMREPDDDKLRLTIVGEGHEDTSYAVEDWIKTPGYVPLEEFVSLHSNASIYVQPSTADAYPVASLEGMLGGTPTVVTGNVGTAHRLPAEQVCSPDPESIGAALQRLRRFSEDERVKRGREHRQSVRELTESRQTDQFAAAVNQIITEYDA